MRTEVVGRICYWAIGVVFIVGGGMTVGFLFWIEQRVDWVEDQAQICMDVLRTHEVLK